MFKEDANGDTDFTDAGDLNQTRTHNAANEITGISESGGQVAWADPTHDPKGNIATYPNPSSMTSSYAARYDAWNRLGRILGVDPVGDYIYDGLGRRITRKTYVGGSLDKTRQFFYSNSWQVIEERVDERTNDLERQYVWGIGYVDELVLRDRDTADDGTLDQRHYGLQDANYSVTCIVDTNGDAQERYLYTPYGVRTILDGSFGARGSSSYDWNIGHQGLMHDNETSLVYNRHRMLHPGLGRFMQRDPLGYVDAANLYEYVRSNPAAFVDPAGLKCRVAVKCSTIQIETDFLGWLLHGSSGIFHCGTVVSDDSGVLVIDAGPQDMPDGKVDNIFVGAPADTETSWDKEGKHRFNPGPYTDHSDEVCACLRENWENWNKHRYKYETASRNSNYALKCLMKKCNLKIKWGPFDLGKPWGYDSKCDKKNECPPDFMAD